MGRAWRQKQAKPNRRKVDTFFGQSPISHFPIPNEILHNVEGMFHKRTH